MKPFFFLWCALVLTACTAPTTPSGRAEPVAQPPVAFDNPVEQLAEETAVSRPVTDELPSSLPTEPKPPEVVLPPEPEAPVCEVYDDFTDPDRNWWAIVNDTVMGGRSSADGFLEENVLVLDGLLNTNGGGFSSIRGELPVGALADKASVQLRIKRDGREYQITFRDTNRRGVSHRTAIPFVTEDQWETIMIDLDDLYPAFFGRRVDAPDLRRDQAREIGFIISDGIDGPFELQIDSIAFCE